MTQEVAEKVVAEEARFFELVQPLLFKIGAVLVLLFAINFLLWKWQHRRMLKKQLHLLTRQEVRRFNRGGDASQ